MTACFLILSANTVFWPSVFDPLTAKKQFEDPFKHFGSPKNEYFHAKPLPFDFIWHLNSAPKYQDSDNNKGYAQKKPPKSTGKNQCQYNQ
jgi:hypothetical protein